MSTQHTPGPWIVRYNGSGYPAAIDAPDADNRAPGKVGTSITRWNAITLPSSEEGQANARLIAASPTMLEALERIVNKFDEGRNVEGHCICDARAAIAKAKGEKQ